MNVSKYQLIEPVVYYPVLPVAYTFGMEVVNYPNPKEFGHQDYGEIFIEPDLVNLDCEVTNIRFKDQELIGDLTQHRKISEYFANTILPNCIQLIREAQVDVTAIKCRIDHLALLDGLPYYGSTMNWRGIVEDKENFQFTIISKDPFFCLDDQHPSH